MSRFHFHLEDGIRHEDSEGSDLPDTRAARMHAVRHIGELLKERPGEFWQDSHLSLTVTDESGLTLFTIEVEARNSPALN